MRICGVCGRQSSDEILVCPKCGADLTRESTLAQSLRRLRESGRFDRVHILVDRECCPACRELTGAYPIDSVPELPYEGCSHAQGCRCRYEPVLDLVGP